MVFNSGINPHVVLFEIIHCSPTRLQYQNIYYGNDNMIHVFDGTKYAQKNIVNVANYLISSQRSSMIQYLSNRSALKILPENIVNTICNTIDSTFMAETDTERGTEKEWEETIKKFNNVRNYLRLAIKSTRDHCMGTYNTFSAANIQKNEISSISTKLSKRIKKYSLDDDSDKSIGDEPMNDNNGNENIYDMEFDDDDDFDLRPEKKISDSYSSDDSSSDSESELMKKKGKKMSKSCHITIAKKSRSKK
jgi:tellurite resistance protein